MTTHADQCLAIIARLPEPTAEEIYEAGEFQSKKNVHSGIANLRQRGEIRTVAPNKRPARYALASEPQSDPLEQFTSAPAPRMPAPERPANDLEQRLQSMVNVTRASVQCYLEKLDDPVLRQLLSAAEKAQESLDSLTHSKQETTQ